MASKRPSIWLLFGSPKGGKGRKIGGERRATLTSSKMTPLAKGKANEEEAHTGSRKNTYFKPKAF